MSSVISEDLREAGFDLNKDDVQEWLAIDRHEPIHAMLTDNEIIELVCRDEKKQSSSVMKRM